MYVCKECGELFEHPNEWCETHGFDYPPYEEFSECPSCGGNYEEAYRCSECGEYISGKYIMLKGGKRICDNCYSEHDTYDAE